MPTHEHDKAGLWMLQSQVFHFWQRRTISQAMNALTEPGNADMDALEAVCYMRQQCAGHLAVNQDEARQARQRWRCGCIQVLVMAMDFEVL
jgi:hypothetical protein